MMNASKNLKVSGQKLLGIADQTLYLLAQNNTPEKASDTVKVFLTVESEAHNIFLRLESLTNQKVERVCGGGCVKQVLLMLSAYCMLTQIYSPAG